MGMKENGIKYKRNETLSMDISILWSKAFLRRITDLTMWRDLTSYLFAHLSMSEILQMSKQGFKASPKSISIQLPESYVVGSALSTADLDKIL